MQPELPISTPSSQAANSRVPTAQQTALTATRRITLAVLVVAGFVVRLHCLLCKPFWFDECFSVEVARISWGNFLRLLWWREANMSFYYVLLRAWLHCGESPFFIRSLSAAISVATIVAVYWLARMLYDGRVAVIAVALFTFNAYSVRYAQEARSYSLFVLLATLSSSFLVMWLRQRTRLNRIAYVLASALAVYAHFYALLLVASHWIAVRGTGALEIASDPQIRMKELRRAWIAIGIAAASLLIFVAKTGAGPIKWIPRPGLRDVLRLFEDLSGAANWWLPAILVAACIAALVPIGLNALKRARDWEAWRFQSL